MAKKKVEEVVEIIQENISVEPLESVMGDRYATYAKYVIQDRAIPDVRDGLKPVQRRIIFSMFKSNNTFNRPTKKCAHTVGAVMGTFHPHGDTSIYEALARMSQNWKVRYPLIDFQGNNGSIDGDSPAAYRYTESRLSELSNELVRDIEKKTVDMSLNFDDTELEPVVLPSRFPNLLVNGTEGIAVGMATEIPPHNLREVIEAVIYRIGHKTATNEDLMQFVKGPDFPGGGIIYQSEGLQSIYTTGRGRIEVASKTEIVDLKDMKQIVISEIPYKVIKIQLVYEIDKIIHSKAVSGMIEVRDETEGDDIRIVIDCKKDAKVELLLNYLKQKTPLLSSYSANMVAIVNGRPRTLSLIEFIDAYIEHQIDVIRRQSQFDLDKSNDRLHIVEGLLLASANINEVVDIIRHSKDKADSKVNLIKRFGLTNEQAEAIVTMPLHKLSHSDEETLLLEKKTLLSDIEFLTGILEDPNKLNRVLVKDLKRISDKYGDNRRTQIQEKEEIKPIDKRELIASEETVIALSRDGYVKRSSLKSVKGSGENSLPGLKDGDILVASGVCKTTDYLVCFTNLGNYACIPVHNITENKWKEEGVHLNTIVTLGPGEKIVKGLVIKTFRNDVFLAFLTLTGQIKRIPVSELDTTKRSKPSRCMKVSEGDEIASIQITTGDSDLLVVTNLGDAVLFNENDLTVVGAKAGGVKSASNLGKAKTIAMMSFDQLEKSKFVIITDKGHQRILDNGKIIRTLRPGKLVTIMPSFKNEQHRIIFADKIGKLESVSYDLHLNDGTSYKFVLDDTHLTDISKYAKKNIEIPTRVLVDNVFNTNIETIDKDTISHPIIVKQPKLKASNEQLEGEVDSQKPAEESGTFEQISIFDDIDE